MQDKRLMVICGESGGHFYPALAFIEYVRPDFKDVILVLPERLCGIIESFPVIEGITLIKISKAGLFRSFELIKRYSVGELVIVGFGGKFSIPFAVCSKLAGVKFILHEQNVKMGRANAVTSLFADKVLWSFPVGRIKKKRKYAVSPLLVRKSLFDTVPFEKRGKRLILVLGGSQGSVSVNEIVVKSVERYGEEWGKDKYFYHICGRNGDLNRIRKAYERSSITADVIRYEKDMGRLYKSADLIISRGGSGVISEVIRFKVPALFIPYPYAGRHQFYNVSFLVDRGAAFFCDEQNLSAENLKKKLDILIYDTILRERLKFNLSRIESLISAELRG